MVTMLSKEEKEEHIDKYGFIVNTDRFRCDKCKLAFFTKKERKAHFDKNHRI